MIPRVQLAMAVVFVVAAVGLFAPDDWHGAMFAAMLVAALFGLLPDEPPKPPRVGRWEPPKAD